MPSPASLLALLAIVSTSPAVAATFDVPDCATDARWGQMAAEGHAMVSPTTVEVAQFLGTDGAPPLTVEVALPADALILGRGLPELSPGSDPLAVVGFPVDRSVLHLELPLLKPPASAEEEVRFDHTSFSAPRVCVVDAPHPGEHTGDTGATGTSHTGGVAHTGQSPSGDTGALPDGYASATCPYDRDTQTGMWRAWRIRDNDVDGSCTVTEVQLAPTIEDQIDSTLHVPRMGVWLPEGDTLEGGDRVLFEMRARAPQRSTDWTGTTYTPNLRWAQTTCPGYEDTTWPASCFDVMPRSDVDGIEVTAGPPKFLRINQPFDAVRGQTVKARFVLLDEFLNPTVHSSDLAQPIILSARSANGPSAWTRDLLYAGTWAESVVVPFDRPGAWTVEADVSGSDLPELTVIRQWTRTWRRAPDYQRSGGDLHFHTGVIDDPVTFDTAQFLPSSAPGDHRVQVARTNDSYRYLAEVMGLQFGAASEHAVGHDSYTLPAGPEFDAFRPGGVCDIGPIAPGIPDWWTHLQQLDLQYHRPGFTVFPAFEWHSHQRQLYDGQIDVRNTRMHRVIVYREVPQTLDLPMLPGTAWNLPSQCLPLFLIASGRAEPDTVQDMVTIPHLSREQPNNLDWDMQYDWSGEFGALLEVLDPDPDTARALLEDQNRLVEVFSARAGENDSFEGTWTDGTNPERWTIRYGLAQGSHVGFVGSSDNHGQKPGSNDDRGDADVGQTTRDHEPGGLAFVIADTSSSARDGIFDALRARRTYGTTGVRVWMDAQITDPSQPVLASVQMGEEMSTSSCNLELHFDLLTAMEAQGVQIYAAQVQHTPGGVSPSWQAIPMGTGKTPTETFRHSKAIPHPGTAGEWVYYVRANLGTPSQPEMELAWSSPFWVTWDDPALCPP